MIYLKLVDRRKLTFLFILFFCFGLVFYLKNKDIKNDQLTGRSVFRFHIRSDLEMLDPALSANAIASYLLNSLHTPLLKYQEHKISAGGAHRCLQISKIQYDCFLRDDWHWSDGQKVVASQIVNGFYALNKLSSHARESFLNVDSVQAISESVVRFKLKAPDYDFLYRLIDPALTPRRIDVNLNSGLITSGSFYLHKRVPGRFLYLLPNNYFSKIPSKVHIEILIVDSDDTALRLYQTKKINFLRRLPTNHIGVYKNSPEFFQVPFARVDYIGFGPELVNHELLRKKLVYSLGETYKQFVNVFDALGTPGCFGLSTLNPFNSSQSPNDDLCYKKNAVQPYTLDQLKKLPQLKLQFSMLGEDDIRRSMEFFQHGWKKNLNLQVELQAIEHGVFSRILQDSPPALFRRGVSLMRPTCLAALEIFESSNPNNFIRFKNTRYDQIVKKLRVYVDDKISPEALCRQGFNILLFSHRLIPLGAIHFSMLADHKFDNFYLNELNQLDVSRLSMAN